MIVMVGGPPRLARRALLCDRGRDVIVFPCPRKARVKNAFDQRSGNEGELPSWCIPFR